MSAFTIYQSPQDIANKLFREAERMLNGRSREDVADHLFNFCVTNTALRDWTFEATKKSKSDNATMTAWRARANGLFGDFADIGNSGKHLHLKAQQATTKHSQMQVVAISGYGRRCCINRFQAKLPQTPAVAMPRLPSEDGPVL